MPPSPPAENAELLVSVHIAAKNAEQFLEEAVRSVLAQDHSHLELLILDDGSSDQSWDILQTLAISDDRIRLFQNESSQGVAASRNRLLQECSPDATFIAVMDADDVCRDNRLSSQLRAFRRHPQAAIVGSSVELIDSESLRLGVRHYPAMPETIASSRFVRSPFAHPSTMIRAKVLASAQGYAESQRIAEDYELWLRLLQEHQGVNLPEPLLRYRLSPGQIKAQQTRGSLAATLSLKRRFIHGVTWLRPPVALQFGLELFLYLLPGRLVYWLFLLRQGSRTRSQRAQSEHP